MSHRTLHHISLAVADLERADRFYRAALAPLGLVMVWTAASAVGYGPTGGGDHLAIKRRDAPIVPPPAGFHVAFGAPDRAAVDAFHAAAITHGGACNGAPGLRPHYGPAYYAAFVIDPDGYRLEAVINTR